MGWKATTPSTGGSVTQLHARVPRSHADPPRERLAWALVATAGR
jgi:hypothetical protein